MTVLDEAMLIVRGIARAAECEETPDVRIVFATPKDQVRFKLKLIETFRPSDVVAAPIASRNGADHLQISGIEVELGNKLRGSRVQLAGIIKIAEETLQRADRRTMRLEDIRAMRQSLSDLLTIVKGS